MGKRGLRRGGPTNAPECGNRADRASTVTRAGVRMELLSPLAPSNGRHTRRRKAGPDERTRYEVAGETTTTRTVAGVKVEQTMITWNDTRRISVDYRVGDVDLYADTRDLTSFAAPLDDEELRDLLATYSLRGFKLSVRDSSQLVPTCSKLRLVG